MPESIRDALTHPWTLAASAMSVFGLAIQPALAKAIMLGLWQSAGTLFTASSIMAFTVAPEIGWLEPFLPYLKITALAAAGLFLAKLGSRIWGNFDKKL